MSFISTPVTYIEPSLRLIRNIEDHITKLDNLVELIVFTPRGSFAADPDFGFEYWNHEFSNVHYREFNVNQTGQGGTLQNDITKKECEDSIRNSLATNCDSLCRVHAVASPLTSCGCGASMVYCDGYLFMRL